MSEIIYRPSGPTIQRFHHSDARRRLILGPIRSGTSVGCCVEMIRRIMTTEPDNSGVRRSRWAVLRPTLGDLKRTTIKTWEQWAAPVFGNVPIQRVHGIIHDIDIMGPDGIPIDAEVIFFSINTLEDIEKLKSLELTGAFVNEFCAFPKAVIDALDDRVGHFPNKRDGGDRAWSGWWADSNMPDTDHWVYENFEEEGGIEGWDYFRQPGAVIKNGEEWVINPEAENLDNLNKGAQFYLDSIQGKSDAHIRVLYAAEFAFFADGARIISDYVDSVHCLKSPIEFDHSLSSKVSIGIDFGATPAASLGQRDPMGRDIAIDEIVAEKVGITGLINGGLGDTYKQLIASGFEVVVTGDPAGGQAGQANGVSDRPFDILWKEGIPANKAHTNAFATRTEVLNEACRTMIDGVPKFRLSPKCKITRKGMAEKYVLKKIANGNRFQTTPDKGPFSHPVEACEYRMMGYGDGLGYGKRASSGGVIQADVSGW